MENFATIAQPEIWRKSIAAPSVKDTPATTQSVSDEEQMVYFCTTASVEDSLKGTIKWSWVIVACTIGLALFEVLAICSTVMMAYRGVGFTAGVILALIKEVAYLPITAILIWHGILFGIRMRTALRHRDNNAFERAFFHQSQYFKWAFMQVALPVAAAILGSLL